MSIDAWIGVLGSEFLREEFLAVLGSKFFLLCLVRSSSRRAWIKVLERSFRWNKESVMLGSKFQRVYLDGIERGAWVRVSKRSLE